jgi:hypothetical protein
MIKPKKCIYTLALKGYAPELVKTTFKLMRMYANKIEADFVVIEERKFPDKYPTYEKFQIYEMAKERKDEYIFFFDADTMIHPDFFDLSCVMTKDHICAGYSSDFTPQRFRHDENWLRDGRYIGKGSWFILCSDWTLDVWKPLYDIPYEQAVADIFPLNDEVNKIKKTPESLIDDYVVSRNIARFGLKHTLINELSERHKFPWTVSVQQGGQVVGSPMLQHDYQRPLDQKVVWTEQVMQMWGVKL